MGRHYKNSTKRAIQEKKEIAACIAAQELCDQQNLEAIDQRVRKYLMKPKLKSKTITANNTPVLLQGPFLQPIDKDYLMRNDLPAVDIVHKDETTRLRVYC